MILETKNLDNQQKYRLLTGGVTPRPIAWISTKSKAGIDNLAPYSFFTVASCNPPVLLYTQVTQRSGIDKDTLQNLKDTGECVVNIANADLLKKVNQTSASLPADQSEFDFAEVKSTASEKVKPLSVKDSPICYECTLREIKSIGDDTIGGTIVLLDVQSIYVRDELYNDGLINQDLIESVGKMGGDYFSSTDNLTELDRP